MFGANVKIISDLKNFVTAALRCPDKLSSYSVNDGDFTRTRKLPFDKLVILIVKLCKKTLSVELEQFFKEAGCSMSCSVSAFSQQRLKLKPLFFYWWNEALYKSFYDHYGSAVKRWKGYRIVAADGSSVSLVDNTHLREHFDGQNNQHTKFVVAGTFYHYDVLNELVLHSQIKPHRYGEVNMAYDAIKHIDTDMVMVYDRNFCSYKMVALHMWQQTERKFVIRLKENFNMAKRFLRSGEASCIEYMHPTYLSVKGLRNNGFVVKKDMLIKVRLVRVELENSVEVLLTNLWEEEGHGAEEFRDLYFHRWKVETNINIQKNILQLECFSGLKVEAVMQDFYATVMMTNIQSILIKDAQQTLEENSQKRKYPMKVNRNKSFGRLKVNVVSLFLSNDEQAILHRLNEYFIKDPVPVRKGRSVKRERKNMQSKSKYKTFTNFKASY